jgi:hypothetical protein
LSDAHLPALCVYLLHRDILFFEQGLDSVQVVFGEQPLCLRGSGGRR